MLNKYRHFYLYAKCHYKQTDIVEDLKKIAGNYTGSSPESERVSDIMSILDDAMNDLFKNVPDSFKKFSQVFLRNTVEQRGFNCEIRSSHLAYIHTCMNIMGDAKVSEINGELGEDDYNILPCHEWNRGV
jgi:hypothetical protein